MTTILLLSRVRADRSWLCCNGHVSWDVCWYQIQADLYQATGQCGRRALLKRILSSPSTRFLVAFRVGAWARTGRSKLPVRLLSRWLHGRWSVRYNLEIPLPTRIGPGLVLNHSIGGILVSQRAVLGMRVRLNPGALVGVKPGGAPRIGNDVTLSNGAKVIGPITIGDGVLVGAGSVVTHDVPRGSVVAGVPARVLRSRSTPPPRQRDFEERLGPVPGDFTNVRAERR